MARKHQHEEHANHEAWAIPYGDLLTLLLAFFVVMYALSSVNEGKYKELAASLNAAFGGPSRSISPVQVGQSSPASPASQARAISPPIPDASAARPAPNIVQLPETRNTVVKLNEQGGHGKTAQQQQLFALSERIRKALTTLVDQKLVRLRFTNTFVEVEIQSDILFASGSATPSNLAVSTTRRIGEVLRSEDNAIRVEGYTDNMPIRTSLYPSNWELSSARAASIVHQLVQAGVRPQRMSTAGFGEYQPVGDNTTQDGRNANRRVMLVILVNPKGADALLDKDQRPVTPLESLTATAKGDVSADSSAQQTQTTAQTGTAAASSVSAPRPASSLN